MKYLSIILLLSMPLAFTNCLEDVDELPPITMEGKNTFGCLVNGKLWLPERGQDLVFEPQLSGDTIGGGNLYSSGGESSFVISIYDVPNLQINKTYDLANGKYYADYLTWFGDISCHYDSIIEGTVTLSRFDRTNNIISGVFEFKAYGVECSDTVVITEGRFDIGPIFK